MKKGLFTYITEFFAVLALVVNSIQFLIFSLFGIEYYADSGTGLVAILNVSCCLYTIGWIVIKELSATKSYHSEKWPYFLPLWIILLYFLESVVFDFGAESIARRQLNFFITFSVPAIFMASYVHRHNRFDLITRNSDIIMLICTLALVLNLPNMLNVTAATIAGAGGHQEISYSAAFCFGLNWVNVVSGNTIDRFDIFKTRAWRYISFGLLPIQAMICILGGGRGGGVLLVLCFIVTVLLYSQKQKGRVLLWTVVALVVFSIVVVQSGQFSEGFGRTFNYFEGGKFSLENDMSDMERTGLREQSYRIIGDSPLVGHGLWNGLIVAGYYMHNVFLDVLISGGFLYLIIFLLVLRKVYKSAFRMINYDQTKAILLPWILYPTTLLMFSGFYMTFSYFWFFCIYCWLNKNNNYSHL